VIVIVGGGICGLSIGWNLLRAGRAVTVLDRAEAGRGATWAAAGMLAAQIECEPGEETLLPLLLESRRLWPGFARELEDAAGMGVDLRAEGTLAVGLDRDDVESLRFTYDYHRGLGLDMTWLSGPEARAMEPHLSPRVAAGVFSPQDHQVDNRKVADALKRAFTAAGGVLREHLGVDEIMISGGRVTGVRAGDSGIRADIVVLAAGAWSRAVAGLPDSVRPPVRPVKGQMVSLRMPAEAPLIRHVVWGPGAYLVPRRDGTLLLGATVEEQSFDASLTAGGVFEILRRAWETLPGVYDLPVAEMWTGFRPTSRDDAPLLGPTPIDGLIVATGHHRNGILLAPVTARAIGGFILTGRLPDEARPFQPSRFAA
jgi:glycine oxidase